MRYFHHPFYFLIILLLAGCSNGGNDDVYGVSGCSISDQNEIVHKALLDRYYWYKKLPDNFNYERFDSPQESLDFLRYSKLD